MSQGERGKKEKKASYLREDILKFYTVKHCPNVNKIKLYSALLSHLQAALISSFLLQNNIWTLEVEKPNICDH